MGKKSALTAAVLLAMGATGTAVSGTHAPELDRGLDLPLPGTAEFEFAMGNEADEIVLAVRKKAKRKTKKKATKRKGPQEKAPCILKNGKTVYKPIRACKP